MGASSAGLTRLLLVAVCVLLARGYEPQYGTDWQVAYNGTRSEMESLNFNNSLAVSLCFSSHLEALISRSDIIMLMQPLESLLHSY